MKLLCKEKNYIEDAEIADTYIKRFLGLMFREKSSHKGALLLCPCTSIHTCFMKFTIDAVYLNKDNIIIYKETLKPWRIGKLIRGTKKVVEFLEGEAKNLEIGDSLLFEKHIFVGRD